MAKTCNSEVRHDFDTIFENVYLNPSPANPRYFNDSLAYDDTEFDTTIEEFLECARYLPQLRPSMVAHAHLHARTELA